MTELTRRFHEAVLQEADARFVEVAPCEGDGGVPIVTLAPGGVVAQVLDESGTDVLGFADVDRFGAVGVFAEEEVHADSLDVLALAAADVRPRDLYGFSVPVGQHRRHDAAGLSVYKEELDGLAISHDRRSVRLRLPCVEQYTWEGRARRDGCCLQPRGEKDCATKRPAE